MSKAHTNVNVYLILKKKSYILLHHRNKTGYCDGQYGLISGHVEKDESAIQSIIREAKEEAGIIISSQDLLLVHCMHRCTDRLNIDLFFSCDEWEGEIQNREPNKCKELTFFPVEALPINTINYIKAAIIAAENNFHYSESGWDGKLLR